MSDTSEASHALPRGIRNNNAGNIRYSVHNKWSGQSGCDDLGFCEFSTPEFGLRALWVLLLNYHRFSGCQTIVEYVSKWAPNNENDTIAYISEVSRSMNVNSENQLDIPQDLPALMKAIIIQENGECPYTPLQLETTSSNYPIIT